MLHFQVQDSSQTLAQGLDEYRTAFSASMDTRHMSPQGRDFFAAHDAVHVVFGCGISLREEAAVKIASIAGTTAGWAVLRGYGLHESLAVYGRLRVTEVLLTIATGPVVVARTLRLCRAQRAPWPWDGHEAFMGTPLGVARARFNIQVLG